MGSIYGVHGKSPSSAGIGVLGQTLEDPTNFRAWVGEAFGVYGISDRQYGVFGYKPSDDGATGAAVFGRSETTSSPAIWGINIAGGPAVQAWGHVSIDQIGVEAHQTTGVDVPGSDTTVVYDNEIVDDRGEYNPSTGEFTCAYDGDYHVEAQIEWPTTLPDNEGIFIHIEVNGGTEIKNFQETAAGTNGPTQGISKTIRNLSAGDIITIVADHNDGSTTHTLEGLSNYAQLTISQIG